MIKFHHEKMEANSQDFRKTAAVYPSIKEIQNQMESSCSRDFWVEQLLHRKSDLRESLVSHGSRRAAWRPIPSFVSPHMWTSADECNWAPWVQQPETTRSTHMLFSSSVVSTHAQPSCCEYGCRPPPSALLIILCSE